MWLANNFGIVPKNEVLVLMDTFETLESDELHKEQLINNSSNDIYLKVRPANQPDDRESYILSEYKIRYLQILTQDGPVGVINDAVAYLDDQHRAPKGKLYKYGLKQIVDSRKYSNEIGIKFTDYNEEYLKNLQQKDKVKVVTISN